MKEPPVMTRELPPYQRATCSAQISERDCIFVVYVDGSIIGYAPDLIDAATLLVDYLGMLREDGLLPSVHQLAWEQQELSESLDETTTQMAVVPRNDQHVAATHLQPDHPRRAR
jgi:hypothetical protein